jgi:hypothetical protein
MILDTAGIISKHFPDNQNWFQENIPFFDCPDPVFNQIYYFRWNVFRKHLKQTPDGYVVTEFLPQVSWSGKHNTICCPAGHHLYEGRWLRNQKCMDDYSIFWFRNGGEPRKYSFWAADAVRAVSIVTGDQSTSQELLDDLIDNWEQWQKSHGDPSGLFWQLDDREGQEFTIGGSGLRPPINSYQYGDALAIASIAESNGKKSVADRFYAEAKKIKLLMQKELWNRELGFFTNKACEAGNKAHRENGFYQSLKNEIPYAPGRQADVREIFGYVPWYFNIPDSGYESAWKQLFDGQGFFAPFGPTTAERRHPLFMKQFNHDCLWNGQSWPFATTQVLVALANLLNNYSQKVMTKEDYFKLIDVYTRSHFIADNSGNKRPWIDEDLHPDTGEWLARKSLYSKNAPGKDRGADYNHSGYGDLIISGLVGLRPQDGNSLVINPLIPEGTWDYFCLDAVRYHQHNVSVVYDKNGNQYNHGKGLKVFVDNKEVFSGKGLEPIQVSL